MVGETVPQAAEVIITAARGTDFLIPAKAAAETETAATETNLIETNLIETEKYEMSDKQQGLEKWIEDLMEKSRKVSDVKDNVLEYKTREMS